MNYVTCSKCGKQVSNKTIVDLIVRAYVECPECIKKQKPIDEHNSIFWVDDKHGNNIICIPVVKLMGDGYISKIPLKMIGVKFRITTEGKHV